MFQFNNLSYHLKKLIKRAKLNRKQKEIINIELEINERENTKTIEKTVKPKPAS